MPRRVAVIIGVQHTSGLPPLPGAVQGAAQMAAWAQRDGWDVVAITDELGQPVTRPAILSAIRQAVDSRTVSQLLLFFAGHGQCWGLDSDFWILSGGTNDADSGVNVQASLTLARQSGIPHIAVFADACRLVGQANDAALPLISGPIFPPGNAGQRSQIDQFYATLPTQAALELQRRVTAGTAPAQAADAVNTAAVEANGVFTECLLKALRGQDSRAKSRLPDGRIVVLAERLDEALKYALPRATGPLPGGFAQQPDCRTESDQVLAQVQAATQCQLQVEARLTDGNPAEGARLELLRHDTQSPDLFVTQRSIRSWSLSERLPWGNIYGVRAHLADHRQDPESPNPIKLLAADEKITVTMVPEGKPPSTLRSAVKSLLDKVDLAGPSLRLETSYLFTPEGQRRERAPSDGVFPVVRIDHLTGDVMRTEQFLRKGEQPIFKPSAASEDLARAIGEAADRLSRGDFETGTGLSVVGAPSIVVHSSEPQPMVFEEDRTFHVRCSPRSASLLLDLGQDRYAALACFKQFVGQVRVGPLGVENLQYLPAAGSDAAASPWADLAASKQAQTALAIAEAAARNGRFEIAVDEAGPVAGILRQFKHRNPVYGVFAAYAYHQAGNQAAIRDMIGYFVDMQQAVPFDVVMLSGLNASEVPTGVAPAYPLLTEGWTYLGPDQHPAVAAARRCMAPTLWATIVGDAGRRLAEAVSQGEIQ